MVRNYSSLRSHFFPITLVTFASDLAVASAIPLSRGEGGGDILVSQGAAFDGLAPFFGTGWYEKAVFAVSAVPVVDHLPVYDDHQSSSSSGLIGSESTLSVW